MGMIIGPQNEPFPLRNTYKWASVEHLPVIHITGSSFDYSDVFHLVGKYRWVVTCIFKSDSVAYREYGDSVTGEINYSKEEWEALQNGDSVNLERIRISPVFPDFDQEKLPAIKYESGVSLLDIQGFMFAPSDREPKFNFDGTKKVPNVVEVPIPKGFEVDADKLWQSYYSRKINEGKQLYLFEKEKFIGITLGVNGGKIKHEICRLLGYDQRRINDSPEILLHYYETKKRRGAALTEAEEKALADYRAISVLKKCSAVVEEVGKAKYKHEDNVETNQILKEIMDVASKFQPGILLYGEQQVYWDIKSYTHIVIRHVKRYQLGENTVKTPIPYQLEALETLIRKVLGEVESEVHKHFGDNPGKRFRRNRRWSVPFNGDYYSLIIEGDGRLATLYPLGDGPVPRT